MIMHGWLCLASAAYLKHCRLQVMRHSCTCNELITAQWCAYMQHSIYSTTRDNGMVKGQRDTCSHPDATSPTVEKLSYSYAPNDESPGNVVATTQTCNAQNRASADAVTCTNNER